MIESTSTNRSNAGAEQGLFFVMAMYLVVDFVRIQDVLPIVFLRPSLIVVVILGFVIIKNGNL